MEKFIKDYIERGFGSMNKNDFEVFIFLEILKMPEYKNMSNYDLSIALRVPETKIKRLRYEAALKNTKPDKDFKAEVRNLLRKAELRYENKKIVFQVEDVLIKSYISNILKKNGRLLDSSFNPELVVININDFEYLAEEVFSKDEVEEIISEAKKLQKTDEAIKLKDVMGWFVQGISSGATQTICDFSPSGIIKTIKNFFV